MIEKPDKASFYFDWKKDLLAETNNDKKITFLNY